MEWRELMTKIRRLEIKTKRQSHAVFSGAYHSKFKGKGMTFSEVRLYQPGDEIRSIDWNVTARLGYPHVKVHEEERELNILLLVDVSPSMKGSSSSQTRWNQVLEAVGIIGFSAGENHDKVGALFYTDKLELFLPFRSGRQNILRVLRDLIEHQNDAQGSAIGALKSQLNKLLKRRSVIFILSDFRDDSYSEVLPQLAARHEVVALRFADFSDAHIPSLGWMPIRDKESGQLSWVNTSSKGFRQAFETQEAQRASKWESDMKRWGIDHMSIHTEEEVFLRLSNLFQSSRT